MSPLVSHRSRRGLHYTPWLVVAFAAAIIMASLSLTLVWPRLEGPVPAAATGGNSFSIFGVYQSPDRCRECHPDEYEAWSGTIHAQASFDPVFRLYLETAKQPNECFACHATGYDTATGQFMLAGVSCEACHGPYRPTHPEATMAIAASAELCGACHPSTLEEWKSSRHGQVGVSCGDCHEVHSQKTRTTVVTNALCAQCHQDHTQDMLHSNHVNAGVACIDCHLSRPETSASSAISGHAATGHAFVVSSPTCNNCHRSLMNR